MIINDFRIGADPEFAAINKGNNLACDINNVWGIGLYPDNNGRHVHFDHGGDVLELTPAPAKRAFIITKHIAHILRTERILQDKNLFRLRAGATVSTGRRKLTLGGHIHFENTAFQERNAEKRAALDVVTKALEAVDILPKLECQERRDYSVFGHFGDFRVGDGIPTVEYRTMCSWLHHPFAAFLCLTLAKLAVCRPISTTSQLRPEQASYRTLEIFLRRFNDEDAKRAVEKIFEERVDLTPNLNVDIRDAWMDTEKLSRRGLII